MAKVNWLSILKVYLESYPWLDDGCTQFCGPERPYMYYDGDDFCVTDATVQGRWIVADTALGETFTDSSVTIIGED